MAGNIRVLRATITIFIGLAFAASQLSAQPQAQSQMTPADFWMSGTAVQGGLVIGRAPKGARGVFLDDAAIELSPDGFFLIGFDRDAPIQARLAAMLADGSKMERNIAVAPGNWRIENVAANITGGAKSSAEFQARRSAELAQVAAARSVRSDSEGWRQTFIRPVSGRISGLFGAQRIYNGTPGSYHNGMDIAAPQGLDFVTPADGVVTLAANDAFTLEGHLLMIDHGMGLNSAFLHASELLVKEGDLVRQGQVIGRVGATGRASGPHLHWGMKWNSARIDPNLLLPSN
ncbi:M23 family metallopeptidase [Sphingorhabdus sp. EL138]|uniref:M23 family metallopeptidase n=1 Tax=Sphingorhabdus sp. EL138 TaxID=2073156 RepID=UPI0025FD7F5B|nr:M23 family metallopeptidase [Sphingorhabdus sp. EL138]